MSKRRAEHEEPEEHEYRSELGRAIARAEAAKTSTERGVAGAAAREFDLPVAVPRRLWPLLLAMVIAAIGMQVFPPVTGEFPYNLLCALAILVLGLVDPGRIFRLLRAPRASAVVGIDGVLVRGQFIPHSQINEICHKILQRSPAGGHGDATWEAADRWIVLLRLVGDKEIDLGTRWVSAGADDLQGADLVQSIEAARTAWVQAQRAPGADEDRIIVTRGARTGGEWLHALCELGSGAHSAYRGVHMDAAHLSRVLDDSRTKPSARAAAAVALAASGDTTAGTRLRIAAGSMADPRLRVALESIASASEDAILAEALETLDSLDTTDREKRV